MDDAIKQTLLARVYDVAIETPLERAHKLSSQLNTAAYLKREDLQPVHSFKLRGAYNKMAQLTNEEKERGVIAASAGNHAQGVALSAKKLGLSALIVMPRTTPAIKVEAVVSWGAEVELAGDSYSDAAEHCKLRAKETGRTYVHPFDDPLVIAGQGTIGREIIEQLPVATHIFIPVGGGGLAAGIAQYVKVLRPDISIITVEPEDSNVLQASLQAGKCITLPHVGIFADGVAVKQMGEHTYTICKQYVDKAITVTNDELCAAIKAIFEETRSIVEPAGALGAAGIAAYAGTHDMHNAHAVAICSGANITFERLQFVAERTLLGSGKEALFAITMPEQPGALQAFCKKVMDGHNITQFGYRLTQRGNAHVFVGVSVRNAADTVAFKEKTASHGYSCSDLSAEDTAKEHVRYMIGGPSTVAEREHFYEVRFPERPGALTDFLQAVGTKWNISLFHYRGQGSDEGNVLVGFETASRHHLEQALKTTGYAYKCVDKNTSMQLFAAR